MKLNFISWEGAVGPENMDGPSKVDGPYENGRSWGKVGGPNRKLTVRN